MAATNHVPCAQLMLSPNQDSSPARLPILCRAMQHVYYMYILSCAGDQSLVSPKLLLPASLRHGSLHADTGAEAGMRRPASLDVPDRAGMAVLVSPESDQQPGMETAASSGLAEAVGFGISPREQPELAVTCGASHQVPSCPFWLHVQVEALPAMAVACPR